MACYNTFMKRNMDDTPTRELVEETLTLTRDSNRRLKSMQRAQFWGGVFKLLFWAVVLGLPIILYYYFLQPYVVQLVDVYEGVQQSAQDIKEVKESIPEIPSWFTDLFDSGGESQ